MGNDDNTNALSYILNLIQEQQESANKINDSFIQEVVKGFSDIKNESKMTNQEMDSKTKEIIEHFKTLNLATTQLVTAIQNSNKTLQEFKKETKTPVSTDTFSLVMTELLGRAHKQSEHAIATHTGSPMIDYGKGKGKKAVLTRNSLRDLMDSSLDRATRKIISFFERGEVDKKEEEKKEKRKFIHTFIDELARSPLIKGTFFDTIKLLTYVAGSWLSKHFGTFGRGVAIALIAAAPILANLLGKAIGDVIGKILTGKFLNLFKGAGGATKGAGAAKGAGGLGVAGGLGIASMALGTWFGFEGVDSWKKGKKGQGALLGGSAGAAIVGGIGLLFGAAFAPVTAALGVIVGLITLAVKHWDKIKEFVESIAEKFGFLLMEKKESPYRGLTLGEQAVNSLVGGEEKGLYSKVKKQGGVLPEDIIASEKVNYKLNKYNLVTNTGEMLQGRAFSEFERYEREYPEQFKQGYLKVSKGDPLSKYIDFSQFTTDVAGNFENGEPTTVYLPRAATEEYLARLEYAREVKPETFTENLGLITGGIATAGSERTKTGSPHAKLSKHFGTGGTFAIDAGFNNEQTAEFEKTIREAVKQQVPGYEKFGALKVNAEGHHAHMTAQAVVKGIVPIQQEEKSLEEKIRESTLKHGTAVSIPSDKNESKQPEVMVPAKKEKTKVNTDLLGYQPNNVFSKCLSEIQTASIFGFTDSARVS